MAKVPAQKELERLDGDRLGALAAWCVRLVRPLVSFVEGTEREYVDAIDAALHILEGGSSKRQGPPGTGRAAEDLEDLEGLADSADRKAEKIPAAILRAARSAVLTAARTSHSEAAKNAHDAAAGSVQ